MGWKELKQKKWFKVFTNTYILVLTLFVIWMLFFDTNSFLIHRELQKEINKLEDQKDYLKKEIEKDKKQLNELKDPKALEKYAREKYYMKKENEEVFLIEYEDSLQ
ncbi:MAG: septum formation initiator family protein [Croceivirga sp.]